MNPVSTMGSAFAFKNAVEKGVAEIRSTATATVPASQPLAEMGTGAFDYEISMHRLRATMRANESAQATGFVLGAAFGGLLLALMANRSSSR